VSNKKRDRLEVMRKLASLRSQLASIAAGENPGLAAVKAEGAAIVAAREAELAAEAEVRDAEPVVVPEKPKKKRGGRNDDVV
jgi:hypothetical protein